MAAETSEESSVAAETLVQIIDDDRASPAIRGTECCRQRDGWSVAVDETDEAGREQCGGRDLGSNHRWWQSVACNQRDRVSPATRRMKRRRRRDGWSIAGKWRQIQAIQHRTNIIQIATLTHVPMIYYIKMTEATAMIRSIAKETSV
jgi:hypothetical protein